MPRFILTTLFLTASAALGIILVLPTYQDWQDLKQDTKLKELELKYQTEYNENVRQISEELEKRALAVATIKTALPDSISLPAILENIQSQAARSGTVIRGVTTLPVMANNHIKKATVKLEAAGSYSDFKEFLSNLEKSARLFNISSISFSFPKEGGNIFSFELIIQANSY